MMILRPDIRVPCLSVALLATAILNACGARSMLDEGFPSNEDAGRPIADSAVPVADSGVPVADSGVPADAGPVCAVEGIGTFVGAVIGGAVDFPFVVAGIEAQSTIGCPRLFIRAGSDPTFSGPRLEIQVRYETTGVLLPGPRPGTMTVFGDTGDPWVEEVTVNVTRADGLLETSLPPSRRAASERHDLPPRRHHRP